MLLLILILIFDHANKTTPQKKKRGTVHFRSPLPACDLYEQLQTACSGGLRRKTGTASFLAPSFFPKALKNTKVSVESYFPYLAKDKKRKTYFFICGETDAQDL